jgi:hypothetical protein
MHGDGVIESVEFSIDEWPALDLFHSRIMLWVDPGPPRRGKRDGR